MDESILNAAKSSQRQTTDAPIRRAQFSPSLKSYVHMIIWLKYEGVEGRMFSL